MRNIIALLQLLALFLVWTAFTALLVPCAVLVWVLKQIVRALEWMRGKATGESNA